MGNKYYNYHCHNHKGNIKALDVIVKQEDYCKRAIELGHDAFFTTCHGMQGDIFEATTLAHQYNLKMIVGAECYYVPDRFEKDKSNRHIIIIALNHEGIRELNNIISESNITGMYYKPRIDDELLFSLTPSNFIITTACVAGLWNDKELILRLKDYFGFNFYLEVQDHNVDIQKEVNKHVLELSKKYNIKIIHANDSHYIYPQDSEYRDLFLKAKGIIYEEENNFILDYPDYDEIVKRYEIQGVLNKNQIKDALENTLVFENIDCSNYINDDIKLPSISDNPNGALKEILNNSWENIKSEIPIENRPKYIDAIRYEMDIIEKTNMANYFLIDYYIAKIAREKYNGVLTKTGRGCFTGDALVHTLKGIKPLKKVEIGDYVVTEDGKFNKVLNTFSYDIEESMIKIKHLYGTNKYYPTICTRDHKILIYRNGNREWIEAQNIVEGDYVCVPKIKFKDNHLEVIDLNDYNDFGYRFDDNFIYEEYDRGNKRYNKTINRYIKIDRTFNEFIGLMYGDGFNNSTKNCDIGLAINTETDKNRINKMIFYNIANRLGVSVYENPSKNKKLNQLYIHSKIFNNFIKKELFQSKKGKDKEFNPKWFNQSKKMVEGIIFGLMNSDGSKATKADHRINFDNTSLSIINAYKLMCLYTEYGVNSLSVRPMKDDKRGYKCKESYKLRINPNAQNTRKISERVLEDKEYYYLPVKEIERIKKQSFRVYDLEVENNHSYLINNMIVHNSAPSFYITRLLDLTNIDRLAAPITLFPTRFMSIERILGARSMPDIDLNSADAEPFIKASKDLLGEENCEWMISWKPLQESSGFRLYCKAIGLDINEYNDVAKDLDKYKEDKKWGELIEKSKPFIGVIEGISESPCSMCLGTENLRKAIGLVRTPNDKICCMLDGYNCDKYKYLKNDYLTVTVWAIIRDVCKLANIPIPTIRELDKLLDEKTFDIYKEGLTCSINQADSNYATGLVKKYAPKSLAEMSAFVAIIRPGCASLLDDFIARKEYTTGVKELDNLLEDSEHRLIYQESIMKYLIWLGIPETGSYDIIKKIAKKKFKEKELKELKDKLIKGWEKQVGREEGFEETWKVVEDAARYSFNCIAGSTKIQRLGQKKSCFNPTIEEMYLIKNDKNYAIKTGHKDLHMKYKRCGYGNAYSMFEDNRIHKNKIIDIYYTGIQKIYRVKTKKGSYVDCTMNHKFPTPTGEKKLQDLTVGSKLYTKSIYEKHPDNYRLTNGIFKSNIPKKGQKGFQVVEDGESHKFMLVYNEKKENKCPCELCYKNFDNSKFELHHINHDRTNNNRENLQWLCNSCHKKQHYKDGRIKVLEKGIPTLIDEIESITYLREDKVYDIEMQNPAHNFVSESGLVVSNCSHSLSYAYDSLYGAYLKSHYPLEYYTIAFDYYKDDSERTSKLTEELKYFNIKLSKPKFRYSKSSYFMDKETNTIYKGVASIKYLNDGAAEYLYSLRHNHYDNFISLLEQIEKDRQINSRQMEILIQLQYFDEFGKNKKLLETYKYFKNLYGRKTVAKDKLEDLGLTPDDVVGCFEKETEKQYINIDYRKILSNIETRIPNKAISVTEQALFEIDVVGYISMIYDVDKRYCLVTDVDTKYSPKVTLYSLGSGKEVICKISKALFKEEPFKKGQLIKCGNFFEKYKQRKTEYGWEQTNVKEWWLTSYNIVENMEV